MSSNQSIRDRVVAFNKPRVLRALLVHIVDKLQDLPPEQQIIAPALAFYCMCKGTGIKPSDVLQMIERMEFDVDAAYANQFDAMVAYARGELN